MPPTSNLNILPDDILYDIISYLSLVDIIRLRQVSKHFNGITQEKTVWRNAYITSTLFLPSVPPHAVNLEHTLTTAYKLHLNWSSPTPQPVSRRSLRHRMTDHKGIHLLFGRYLILGNDFNIKCYDLDLDEKSWETPICSYSPGEPFRDFQCCTASQETNTACVALLQGGPKFYITLLKLCLPPSSPSFEPTVQTPSFQLTSVYSFILSSNFLLHPAEEAQHLILFHIPTQRSYKFHPHNLKEHDQEDVKYVITPRHVLVMIDSQADTFFEVFSIPDVEEGPTISVLTRSYTGTCPLRLADLYLIKDRDSEKTITLLALTRLTWPSPKTELQLLDVTLTDHGQITFSTISTTILTPPVHISSVTTTLRGVGTARVVYQIGEYSVRLLGLDIDSVAGKDGERGEGDVRIQKKTFRIGLKNVWEEFPMAFDGFRGRFCLGYHTSCVKVLDFV